jgi:hypothetical protein
LPSDKPVDCATLDVICSFKKKHQAFLKNLKIPAASIFTGTNRPNMTDTLLKNRLSEYTEAEFIKRLEELAKEDDEAENDD